VEHHVGARGMGPGFSGGINLGHGEEASRREGDGPHEGTPFDSSKTGGHVGGCEGRGLQGTKKYLRSERGNWNRIGRYEEKLREKGTELFLQRVLNFGDGLSAQKRRGER